MKEFVITLFGLSPFEDFILVDNKRYIYIDNRHRSLYGEAVLRAACRLLEAGTIPLMDHGGYHRQDENALIGKHCGTIYSPVWDGANFQVLAIARLNDYGQRVFETKSENGLPVFLSWQASVSWQFPNLKSGKAIVSKIHGIESVDFVDQPLCGGRFGRLPKRNFKQIRRKSARRTTR